MAEDLKIVIHEIDDPNELYQDKFWKALMLSKVYGKSIKNHPRHKNKETFAQHIVDWCHTREDR